MSFKMIIVDDEPPFIRMLENSLIKVTDQIQLIATANNGVEDYLLKPIDQNGKMW